MGQCASRANLNRAESPTEIETFMNNLTIKELALLKISWDLLVKNKIGERILVSFLLNQPDYGRHFGIDAQQSEASIRVMNSFLVQGQRMQGFLDTVVLSLAHARHKETIIQSCQRVGSIHFYRGVNLEDQNWAYLECLVLDEMVCICKERFKDKELIDLCHMWKNLLRSVTEQIRIGFLNETIDNFSKKSSTSSCSNSPCTRQVSLHLVPADPMQQSGPLSEEEAESAKVAWRSACNDQQVAMELLVHMVTNRESYAKLFGFESTTNKDEIAAQPAIKVQAQRIHGFLDVAVNVLATDQENLRQLCRRVGAVHFRKGVNFTADVWLLFKRIIVETITSSNDQGKNGLAVQAWERLMRYIVHEMKEGFLELARNQSA